MQKYETIMQAYNAMKGLPASAIEARAQAINADIAANPNADVASYAIELEALERILEEGRTEARSVAPQGVERTAAGTMEAEDKAASPEYRTAFYKHLQGNRLTSAEQAAFDAVNVERRDNAFATLSNSAAVIPTTTLDAILSKARDMGGIMSIARAFNMPANVRIPVATPGQAASWHTEGDTVETERPSVEPVEFGAWEIMKILSISAATRTMSIGAFESYLTDELTASIMATLAKGMVDGNGDHKATGILEGITWGEGNSVNMAATGLKFADIIATIAKLHRGYANGAKFVMSNETLYSGVYGLEDDNGRPVYVTDLTQAGKGRVMGFDVVIDDYMPADTILFGNFRFYGYNLPSGIALDVSRESSFSKGLIDYRALAVADAKPIIDEAFVKLAKGE